MAKLIVTGLAGMLIAAGAAAGASSAPSDRTPQLFTVPSDPRPAAALAKTDARVVARYRAFTLVEASGDDAERLARAGADRRDDLRRVRIGRRSLDPARDRGAPSRRSGPGLAVVQFVGPIKDSWLARLRKTGVRVVTYMAQDGYLVHGSGRQLARVAGLVGRDPAVRAVVPYRAADKVAPGIGSSGTQRLAVQTLSGDDGASARSDVADAGRELRDTSAVGPFRTQYVQADAAEAAKLAADPGVVAVLPAPVPKLTDEAQDQILAGNTTGSDPLLPSGAGYLGYIDPIVGSSTFPFTVDVTDSGIDAGVVGTTHPDLHVNGNGGSASRLGYVTNWTTDSGASAGRDCGGHGTINTGIIGGFNNGSGSSGAGAVEDSNGYNYGLGVAPRASLGGSKIFLCSGNFSLTSTFTSLTNSAYTAGARISSNSWGCGVSGGCEGSYNTDSQEYDKLVRDAVPATAGNQEMVEVFSAGNDGTTSGTIGTPGTAKNVLTVGAAENVRALGAADGCGVSDSGADDAHDIIDFSSRGPTNDGRLKPEIVGPGTHIVDTKPQHAGYVGDGVCNGTFPSGSTFYSESSGTSHSTPALAGMAALVRKWYSDDHSGTPPSPAMTKAILAQSGSNLAGGSNGAGGANTNAPDQVQGWGLANLKRALDTGPRFFRDQQDLFDSTGDSSSRTFAVQDTSKPVRVTLAWTDAYGPTTGNSFVNDLNLSVAKGGSTYKGNVFSGGQSVTGGTADSRNNLESVYLPAGTSGQFSVSVDAANIAGDGVPANPDSTDQDFALTVSNVTEVTAPILSHQSTTLTPGGDADGALEPGESFTVSELLKNDGTASATGISGTLTGPGSVSISDGTAAWPDLGIGASAANSDALAGTVASGASCGSTVNMSLAITSAQGANVTVPISVDLGSTSVSQDSSDVPKFIPDNNPGGVTSTLSVSQTGTIGDVNVRVGSLAHSWVGDLKIDLTSPNGTTVNLVNSPGGVNNSANNFTDVVFDDEASATIGTPPAESTPAYTGSLRPQTGTLSSFDGGPQNGTWTLKVVDQATQDNGYINAWGNDIRTSTTCDYTATPPGAIANLGATGGPSSVVLDWDDTATATGYKVFRKSGGSYPSTPTATPSSSALTDTGRTPGVQDCYKVQASNGSGDGPMSGEVCATPTQSPPGAVANLSATGALDSVGLEWDDTATATGYKVFRKSGGSYPSTPTATPSSSDYSDPGLTAGTQYCYKVRATNAGGDGPLSGEVCATAQGPPPGPITGLTAAGGPVSVALDWDDTASADDYYVFRKASGGGYPVLPTATVSSSNHTDNGRTAGVEDCYEVQAHNAFGTGALSTEVCATPTPGPPGSVSGLSATGALTSVALDWDDTATATGYKVFRKSGGSYPSTPTATPSSSDYTDPSLTAGTQYCYKVRAANGAGDGPLSGEVCATAQGPPPGAISGLRATAGPSRVTLDWNDASAASEYDVFRKGGGGSYPVLPTATQATSGYVDSGRPAGVRQCYRVRARNAFGAGAMSVEACATPTASSGGGGGGGETPVLPVLPKLDLSGLPGSIRADSRGRFRLSFSGTPETAGALTLKTVKKVSTSRKRKLTLLRKRFTSSGSGRVKLRLKLSRSKLRVLRRYRRLKVALKVKLGSRTSTRRFTLRAPKKKRRR